MENEVHRVNRWVVSDTHFGHANTFLLFKGDDGNPMRPFSSVKEMDECMIDGWNERVRPQDRIYHLGDVTLARGGKPQQDTFVALIKKLNGHKILFKGNHDHFPIITYLRAGFEDIRATWRDGNNYLFSHFPLHPSTLSTVVANVHGHIHHNNSPTPAVWTNKEGEIKIVPFVNVSVEKTNYHPISFEELAARIELAKTKLIIDSSYPKVVL